MPSIYPTQPPLLYRGWLDKSILDRENGAILDRIFTVEYLSGGHGTPLHMRLHFGAIPISPDFTPDALWKPLRGPSLWMEKLVT